MVPARFWLREEDQEHFFSMTFNALKRTPDKYVRGLVTGETKGLEELKRYTRHVRKDDPFIFGAIRPWDALRDHRCLKVQIEPYDLHPHGLVLTNYHEEDLHFHQPLEVGQQERIRKFTISETTNLERTEFISGVNFVDQAYKTFYERALIGRAKTDFTPRLLLYDPDGQLDEMGNMANPTTADNLEKALEQKRQQKLRTETFRE
ncbi:MAG: hypothetical protein AABW82_02360 [Nanoarchaeota archaeon]